MIIDGYSLKEYDSEIIKLYSEGYSMEHIGKILGLSRHSISYRLDVNNVNKRPHKGIKHSQRNPTISL
jgi:predicted transcriptional regulator